jgi:hypothetical protein
MNWVRRYPSSSLRTPHCPSSFVVCFWKDDCYEEIAWLEPTAVLMSADDGVVVLSEIACWKNFPLSIESMDYFKNEISSDWLEWLNPDEIEAGGTTCGFLHPDLADLGSLHGVTYPIIWVYVCVRFANVQPAAKGNMFVHCGGPGTLSSCTNYMIDAGYFSETNLDEYNIWSIDQVGIIFLRYFIVFGN